MKRRSIQSSIGSEHQQLEPSAGQMNQALVAWWGKLVHRMVIEEVKSDNVQEQRGDDNDIKDNRISPTTARLHIRAAVDINAGDTTQRINRQTICAG
jgi:hypothetical protein